MLGAADVCTSHVLRAVPCRAEAQAATSVAGSTGGRKGRKRRSTACGTAGRRAAWRHEAWRAKASCAGTESCGDRLFRVVTRVGVFTGPAWRTMVEPLQPVIGMLIVTAAERACSGIADDFSSPARYSGPGCMHRRCHQSHSIVGVVLQRCCTLSICKSCCDTHGMSDGFYSSVCSPMSSQKAVTFPGQQRQR